MYSHNQKVMNEEKIASIVNDLWDNKNPSDGAALLEDTPFTGSCATPTLIPDNELSCKIRSLNYERRKLFDIVQGWAKRYAENKSFSSLAVVETLHIFLTDDADCTKLILMKVMNQSLTKILYGNLSVDKPKVLLKSRCCHLYWWFYDTYCTKYPSRSLWK